MTPSRLFIVLLRALGVYLIAVYGAAAIMHAAGLLNVAGLSSEEYERTAPFLRRDLIGRSLVTAFGLYALFGGRALLALLPSAWRDDPAGPIALDARALSLVTVRMVGFVLIAAHLPALVRAVQVGVSASDAWAVAAGVLPVAIGVYLLLGGGWIVRQASAVQGEGPRTVRVGAGGGTNP